MMTLKEYLAVNRVRQVDFASSVGATQSTISRLVQGFRPSLELAVAIERVTGGAVPASSWVPCPTVAASEQGE